MPRYPVPFKFSSYELLEALPAGGSGAVYKARHLSSGDMVAIKFFDHDPKREPTRFSYFTNEQTLLRAITKHREHPYIIKHMSHNFTKEPFYVVTRYVAGAHPLANLPGKPIEPGFVLRVVEQLSKALDYIHYAHPDYSPIIHRDVNPNNILIDEQGNAVLIDFGSALHSQFALREEKGLGTISYMSPEQYEGNETPATDQFALAAVTFRMLTGKNLLPSQVQSAKRKLESLKDNDWIRNRLGQRYTNTADVISKATSFEPTNRYETCEAFAYNLRKALQKDGLELTQSRLPTKSVRSFSSTPDWVGWVVMAIIIVGALTMLIWAFMAG